MFMAVVMVIVEGMMAVNGNGGGGQGDDGAIDGFSNGDGIVVRLMVMVVLEMMLIVMAMMIIVNGWY